MKLDINTDEIFDSSNLEWLKENTIYLTLHGSHAYGTSRPGSDIDLRGIAIPPKKYYFGILDNFEQVTFSDPNDCVIFDIRKFIGLALKCNPNAIELLFTDREDHVYRHPAFDKLEEIRDSFLSTKAKYTFAGYARSQLLRIKRHRKWILNPLDKKPEREDFGLPENKLLIPKHKLQEIEAQVQKKINEWNFDATDLDRDVVIAVKNNMHDILVDLEVNQDEYHMYAARSLGADDNLLEAFRKEKAYTDAIKDWKNYNTWKSERNKERYEMESKFGFDCKHGMHLVRLYKQCVELLEHQTLTVKRPDAAELLEIRNGAWSYDELIEWADEQDKVIDRLYKTSTLPKKPNNKLINSVCIELIESFI